MFLTALGLYNQPELACFRLVLAWLICGNSSLWPLNGAVDHIPTRFTLSVQSGSIKLSCCSALYLAYSEIIFG